MSLITYLMLRYVTELILAGVLSILNYNSSTTTKCFLRTTNCSYKWANVKMYFVDALNVNTLFTQVDSFI